VSVAESRNSNFKVGVFVSVLTVGIGLTTFLVGGSASMFDDRYTLNASWSDIAGLKEGAVVRLAGWDVGEVNSITFSDDPANLEIHVEMSILNEYQNRVRQCPSFEEVPLPARESGEEINTDDLRPPGSHARIETMGVLGDKYVALTMGPTHDPNRKSSASPQGPICPEIADGAIIRTEEALDILEYTSRVTEILNSTSSIGQKVDLLLGDDQALSQASLAESFTHLKNILEAAKDGNGLLNALIYDEQMPKRVDNILANLESTSAGLADVTREIKTGDGIATELIYGENGEELAEELRELAVAMSSLTEDIRNEESLIHTLIYDPEKAAIIDDLAATAASLRTTSEMLESGEGTLGLMARDPALYEELRALVGGAQRNKLLRAYIRQTVAKSEEEQAGAFSPDIEE
jgi:phospholipid/cholesterol/gamma-HCH transport system substrate-binding protein